MNNAGLPGTGIGGFFYLMMAFLMPFMELWQTIQGKSSWKRWKLVIRQVIIASGVIGGVEAAGWGAKEIFHIQPAKIIVRGFQVGNDKLFVTGPFLLSFATLAVVLILIRMWSLWVRLSLRKAD